MPWLIFFPALFFVPCYVYNIFIIICQELLYFYINILQFFVWYFGILFFWRKKELSFCISLLEKIYINAVRIDELMRSSVILVIVFCNIVNNRGVHYIKLLEKKNFKVENHHDVQKSNFWDKIERILSLSYNKEYQMWLIGGYVIPL